MIRLTSLVLIAALVGCGSTDSSIDFNVSGQISFKGKPVPVGFIQFVPLGGTGTQGYAKIKNGAYDTSIGAQGRGISAGEHLVKIVGYDGVAYEDDDNEVNGNGSLLFAQYQIKKTFDGEERTFDVQIPSS